MNKPALLFFLVHLGILLSLPAFAQKNKDKKQEESPAASTAKPTEEFARKEKTFRMALQYSDGIVAKQALYDMMVLQPSREDLKDTLAMLYFNLGQFVQCMTLADEILAKKENNTLLEMKAVSETNLGALKEALKDYETLFQRTQNVLFLYEIATLQYQLKRYGEGASTTEAILASDKIGDSKVNVNIGQNRNQQVPLKAAVHNLRGVMAMELKQYDAAQSNFEAAVKEFPDFVLANNNLKVVQETKKENAANGKK